MPVAFGCSLLPSLAGSAVFCDMHTAFLPQPDATLIVALRSPSPAAVMVSALPPGVGMVVLRVTCASTASKGLSLNPLRISLSSNSTKATMSLILSHSAW